MDDVKHIRLNKFISNSGYCNRREADNFIVQGRVSVNDKVVIKLGTKVSINDNIKLDGNNVSLNKPVYILLNKPKGFHSINLDNKKNIFSLLPFKEFHDLQSLDFMNENYMGLMIFSNNQDFITHMTNKIDNLKQLFHVILDSDLKQDDKESIKSEAGFNDIRIRNINHVDGASKNEIGLELSIKQVVNDFRKQKFVEHVIVIDNKSTDNTVKIARESGAEVVEKMENKGYSHSLVMGFKEALKTDCNIIATVEADGTFNA
jgi:16S rRNA U516 pseudouridylate synthase RsuA-like enzyme